MFKESYQVDFTEISQIKFKMLFSSIFTATALLAAQAAAHGAVTSYEIDGTKYPGYISRPNISQAISYQMAC